jgi:hypothetical protein
MSLKEFEEYIQTGSFHAVYMSCSPGEKSYSSDSLMHGIWTWHLIRALRGEESAAIVRENFITSSSLKDYLCIAVPDYIRKNTEIRGTQIPWSQIASANTFEIIKLPQHHIINQGALFDLELKLDEMIFRRLIIKPISKLPGFDKKRGHFVPDYISTQVTDFIQRLVEDEIKEEINIIYDKTKRIMNLKKKEIYKSAESGGGSLDTEYFRFKIFAEQSQDEPDEAVIMRTLEIRGDYKRLPIDFDDIFPYRLDEIVIPFSGNVDFEVLVDKFEDLVDSLGGTLSENDDTGIIEFRTIQGLKITIQVYNNELVLYSREAEGCIKMIEKARKEILELSTLKSKLLS